MTSSWLRELPNRGIAVQVAALMGVTLAVLAMAGSVALVLGGGTALAAAVVAAGACLAGAVAALIASHALAGASLALAALLTGMAARLGIPLALGLAIHLHGGPLAEAGLLYYLLLFYPVTLGVETLLSLPATSTLAGNRP